MDDPTPAAGRVIGTEAARPLEFHVHVAAGQLLQLDDIVAVTRAVPGQGAIELYGVVTEVRACSTTPTSNVSSPARCSAVPARSRPS